MPTYTAASIDVAMYGQFVSFSVIPTGAITTEFTNVQVVSVIDWQTAMQKGYDIYSLHAQVYPALVAAGISVPNDPTKYNWLLLGLPGNQKTVIGIPWIDFTTFEVVVYTQLTVVYSGISNTDVDIIKQNNATLGYNNVSYTST